MVIWRIAPNCLTNFLGKTLLFFPCIYWVIFFRFWQRLREGNIRYQCICEGKIAVLVVINSWVVYMLYFSMCDFVGVYSGMIGRRGWFFDFLICWFCEFMALLHNGWMMWWSFVHPLVIEDRNRLLTNLCNRNFRAYLTTPPILIFAQKVNFQTLLPIFPCPFESDNHPV